MPSQMFVLPFRPIFDSNLKTIPGAQAYFTFEGTNSPSSPYADEALSSPLANPVVANALGRWPAIYLDTNISYRVRIYAADAIVGVSTPLDEYDPWGDVLGLTTDPTLRSDLAEDEGGTLIGVDGGLTLQQALDQKTDDSEAAAISSRVDNLESTVVSGVRVYPTYSALSTAFVAYNPATAYVADDTVLDQSAFWVNILASTGTAPPTLPATSNASWRLISSAPSGLTAQVPSTDSGTHTDPVVGGTKDNSGVFRYSITPAGWERIADLDSVIAEGFADAAAASAASVSSSAETVALADSMLGDQEITQTLGAAATGAAFYNQSAIYGPYSDRTEHEAKVFRFKGFRANANGSGSYWGLVDPANNQLKAKWAATFLSGQTSEASAFTWPTLLPAGLVPVFIPSGLNILEIGNGNHNSLFWTNGSPSVGDTLTGANSTTSGVRFQCDVSYFMPLSEQVDRIDDDIADALDQVAIAGGANKITGASPFTDHSGGGSATISYRGTTSFTITETVLGSGVINNVRDSMEGLSVGDEVVLLFKILPVVDSTKNVAAPIKVAMLDPADRSKVFPLGSGTGFNSEGSYTAIYSGGRTGNWQAVDLTIGAVTGGVTPGILEWYFAGGGPYKTTIQRMVLPGRIADYPFLDGLINNAVQEYRSEDDLQWLVSDAIAIPSDIGDVFLQIPNLLHPRPRETVEVTLASSGTIGSQTIAWSTTEAPRTIKVPPSRIGSTMLMQAVDLKAPSAPRSKTVNVSKVALAGSALGIRKTVLLGDSTSVPIQNTFHTYLQSMGYTHTLLGTRLNNGVLGEGYSGWKAADMVGLTTRAQVVAAGTEAAYLASAAAGTAGDLFPWIRASTGADNLAYVRNGKIFDPARMVSLFGFSVPDEVNINLYRNDVDRSDVTFAQANTELEDALGIMVDQILLAWPSCRVRLWIFSAAVSVDGQISVRRDYLRTAKWMQAKARANPTKIKFCAPPLFDPHLFQLSTASTDASTAMLTSSWSDNIHPSTLGYQQLALSLACAAQAGV